MALLKINGVDVSPTPTTYDISILDITKAERNANGQMIIERIAQKRKIAISYAFLTAAQLSTLLNQTSAIYYDVTYLDPVSNSYLTSSFYNGDKNIGMVDFLNGVPRYKDFKLDLIER